MIYFQQTNYQIAFLISQESVSLISQWRKGFEYSRSQMEYIRGAADGTPSFPTILRVVDNQKVNLTMKFDFNYTFEAVVDGCESTELVYMKATDYPHDIREPRDIVLKIEGEPYESLIGWDKWFGAEAFTGKYTYEFFENPTFDMKYIKVTASGGEVIWLDDSLSFWNY